MNIQKLTIQKVLACALLLGLLVAACGQVPQSSLPEQLREAAEAQPHSAGQSTPAPHHGQPTAGAAPQIEPVELPLDAALPRSITYASLEWTVSAAVIDNRVISLFGESDKRTDKYRVARMTLHVKNPLSGYTDLDSNVVKLQLGDGKLYESDETGRVTLPGGNAQTESKLIFRVPADATWDGAKLMISEAQRMPALLPLQGAIPSPEYPIKLKAGGEAITGKVAYTILDSAVALDLHAKRTKTDERFLKLTIRVQNNSKDGGGLPLGEEHFRLVVDGAPIAPADAPIKLVKPNSAYDAKVAFAVPATITKAELRVGEAGADKTAPIPLDLQAMQP